MFDVGEIIKMAKKPSGKIGTYKVQFDKGGVPRGSFEQVKFSEKKEEIEEYVVSRFIYSAEKALATQGERFIVSNPVPNQLDDFDFDVETPQGSAYLELMEAAPLETL